MNRTRLFCGLTAAVATFVACGSNFKPQSFIDKPRIIGIRADPPEVQFTDAEQGNVALTVFLALPVLPPDGPAGPRELKSLDWTMCGLNLGSTAAYACAVPELPLVGDITTATATFDGAILYSQMEIIRPMMPRFIEFVKRTVAADDTCQQAVIGEWDACVAQNGGVDSTCIDPGFVAERTCLLSAGQDITFHVTAVWTDGTQDLVAEAYKKVRFRSITTDRPANRNPAFTLTVEKIPLASTGGPLTGTVLACPGQAIKLEPVLADETMEKYLDAKGEILDEFLFLSWYTPVGAMQRLKSSTATVSPGDPIDLTNKLTLPGPADTPESFMAWVFIRDDRLGLDGLEFEVRRRPDAECVAPAGFSGVFTPPAVEVVPYVPVSTVFKAAGTGGAA